MILDSKKPKNRAFKQSKWQFAHRQVLNKCRLSGRRRCGRRSVSCYHFFKHSRGFLWFMLCNLLLGANNSDAQLLINVQNQVRFGLELRFQTYCECQNCLLSSMALTALLLAAAFVGVAAFRTSISKLSVSKQESVKQRERESAVNICLLCISCNYFFFLFIN